MTKRIQQEKVITLAQGFSWFGALYFLKMIGVIVVIFKDRRPVRMMTVERSKERLNPIRGQDSEILIAANNVMSNSLE